MTKKNTKYLIEMKRTIGEPVPLIIGKVFGKRSIFGNGLFLNQKKKADIKDVKTLSCQLFSYC